MLHEITIMRIESENAIYGLNLENIEQSVFKMTWSSINLSRLIKYTDLLIRDVATTAFDKHGYLIRSDRLDITDMLCVKFLFAIHHVFVLGIANRLLFNIQLKIPFVISCAHTSLQEILEYLAFGVLDVPPFVKVAP